MVEQRQRGEKQRTEGNQRGDGEQEMWEGSESHGAEARTPKPAVKELRKKARMTRGKKSESCQQPRRENQRPGRKGERAVSSPKREEGRDGAATTQHGSKARESEGTDRRQGE